MTMSELQVMWPPARIRIVTPRLELRMPTDVELIELGSVAAAGVHGPDTMPFARPWSDADPAEIPTNLARWHWQCRAGWSPGRWSLILAAFVDGEPVGMQDIYATDLRLLRTVSTGSWLGRAWQGQRLGREMRDAVLHFAFEGLGVLDATSGAYEDNHASIAVSTGAGYEPDGVNVVERSRGAHAPGGASRARALEQRFRITRDRWAEHRRVDIEIHGLDEPLVREWFGLG